MKKRVVLLAAVAGMSVTMGMSAFASGWQKNNVGWWYGTNADNTTWYANGWQWVDGNSDGIAECYYFDQNGYALLNCVTPDGYQVDASGAWIADNKVQTKEVAVQTDTSAGSTSQTLTPKANLKDLTPEASQAYDHTYRNELTYGGENWDGCSQYRVGNGYGTAYADFFLGNQYTKLTFKVNPRTEGYDNFQENTVDTMTVLDQQTGKVLASCDITHDSRMVNVEADVSGVNYLRIQFKNNPFGGGSIFGYVLVKDAILY